MTLWSTKAAWVVSNWDVAMVRIVALQVVKDLAFSTDPNPALSLFQGTEVFHQQPARGVISN